MKPFQTSWLRSATYVLIGCSVVLGGQSIAKAGELYTFTGGANFDSFDGNSNGLTSSNSITGFVELSSALGANFNSFNSSNPAPTLVDWNISDGVHTLNASTAGDVAGADFRTDGAGNIINWTFSTANFSDNIRITVSTEGGLFNDGINGSVPIHDISSAVGVGTAWYGGAGPFGSWVATETSSAPEPASLSLVAGAALFLIARKRLLGA